MRTIFETPICIHRYTFRTIRSKIVGPSFFFSAALIFFACEATEPNVVGTEVVEGSGRIFAEDQDGRVVIEAEHYASNTQKNGVAWEERSMSGASGGVAMTTPNQNKSFVDGYVSSSPKLTYQVELDSAGLFYVWIRGSSPDGNSDSCHVGMDGLEVSTAKKIAKFETRNTWVWSSRVEPYSAGVNGRSAISVGQGGAHSLELYLREDGFNVDKIVLTRDPNFIPTGLGPRGTAVEAVPMFAQTAEGIVSIEAEHFNENSQRSGRSWQPVSIEGVDGMQVPEENRSYLEEYSLLSPRLIYAIDFTKKWDPLCVDSRFGL